MMQAAYRGRLQRSGRGFLVKPHSGRPAGRYGSQLIAADTVQYLNRHVRPALVAALVRTAIEQPVDPILALCAVP